MTRLKQDVSTHSFSEDKLVLEDIKNFLILLKCNQALSKLPEEMRTPMDRARYLESMKEQENEKRAIPKCGSLLQDKEDLSQFSNPESDELLKKLQSIGILPIEQPDLKNAIYLLDQCTECIMNHNRDLVNPLILNTVANAQKKGWGTLHATYTHSEHRDWQVVEDVIRDYIKAIVYPRLLRGAKKIFSESQKAFIKCLSKTEVKWQGELMPFYQFGISILCEGKDISELAAFSDHWHNPLQQSVFQILKHTGDVWPSLFQSREESVQKNQHKEISVPEGIVGKKNYKFMCHTTHEELVNEGKQLNHCVGGYTKNCQLGSSHILSLLDENGKSISTLELKLEKNHRINSIQHRGYKNIDPSEIARKAHDWLIKSLNNEIIPIDFNYLEEKLAERAAKSPLAVDGSNTYVDFYPYDDIGLIQLKKVHEIYRKHTLPCFKENFHRLSHLDTLKIKGLFPRVNTLSKVEIDLLTEEERNTPQMRKEARAMRWFNPKKRTFDSTVDEKVPDTRQIR